MVRLLQTCRPSGTQEHRLLTAPGYKHATPTEVKEETFRSTECQILIWQRCAAAWLPNAVGLQNQDFALLFTGNINWLAFIIQTLVSQNIFKNFNFFSWQKLTWLSSYVVRPIFENINLRKWSHIFIRWRNLFRNLHREQTDIVFQKFSCTRLEGEFRVRRTGSYVVEKFDR